MGRLLTKSTFADQSRWIALARVSDFRVAKLARHMGISQRQVQRYVKRHFDCTPQQWMQDLRMARACELIEVMHSVKEISYTLGYNHVSTFCHTFKAHHGITCSQYAAKIAARKGIIGRQREAEPIEKHDWKSESINRSKIFALSAS